MPKAVRERARVVRGSDPQNAGRMRAVPILGESHSQPPYKLLTAQTVGKVRITEVDTSGSVPELAVHINLDVVVFLLDSKELIGAKQNRIINTDVMVPAHTTLKMPVNCVEQGRRGHNSPSFSPGKSASYRTRRRKSTGVH
ncbi:MAG: hypothetical protein OEU26_32600 [Candidatus Tectomicrobia bacterium]|nr:hypothetical protein [Candidatus Tectomicrobia bacterium]